MKVFLRAVLDFIRSIDFATIISGALVGLGGFWGRLLSFIAKPVITSIETKIDNQITQYETEQTADTEIDQKAKSSVDQNKAAQTDEEIDASFRDSIR